MEFSMMLDKIDFDEQITDSLSHWLEQFGISSKDICYQAVLAIGSSLPMLSLEEIQAVLTYDTVMDCYEQFLSDNEGINVDYQQLIDNYTKAVYRTYIVLYPRLTASIHKNFPAVSVQNGVSLHIQDIVVHQPTPTAVQVSVDVEY